MGSLRDLKRKQLRTTTEEFEDATASSNEYEDYFTILDRLLKQHGNNGTINSEVKKWFVRKIIERDVNSDTRI
jgi:hypothetical protein